MLRSLQYPQGKGIAFWCPGCRHVVGLPVEGSPAWQWDGNVDKPTVSPSVLQTGVEPMTDEQRAHYMATKELPPRVEARCHLFLKNGMLEFLSDCTHELAGQTVPLPPWPAGMNED